MPIPLPQEGQFHTVQQAEEWFRIIYRANGALAASLGMPPRYLPPYFVANLQSDMVRDGWTVDDGSRPAGLCWRKDTGTILRLTGGAYSDPGSWSPWVEDEPGLPQHVVSATQPAPSGFANGTFWFQPATGFSGDRVFVLRNGIWTGPVTTTSLINSVVGQARVLYGGSTPQNRNRHRLIAGNAVAAWQPREWFATTGQHRVVIPYRYFFSTPLTPSFDKIRFEPGSFDHNIGAHSFVSYVYPQVQFDAAARTIWRKPAVDFHRAGVWGLEVFEAVLVFGIIQDTDPVPWTVSGHLLARYSKPDSQTANVCEYRIDGGQWNGIPLTDLTIIGGPAPEARCIHEIDLEEGNLSPGNHTIEIRNGEGDENGHFQEVHLTPFEVWHEDTTDTELEVPSIHAEAGVFEIRLAPTFAGFRGCGIADPFFVDGDINGDWQSKQMKYFVTADEIFARCMDGPGGANAGVLIARPFPSGFNFNEFWTVSPGNPNTRVADKCWPDGTSANPPGSFNGVSVASPLGNARIPCFRHDVVRMPAGAWTILGGNPPEHRLSYPFRIHRVQAHRIPQRDPAVTTGSDGALEVEVGHIFQGSFVALISLNIAAGEASSDPYFPDWLNLDGGSMHYRVAGDPDALCNVEIIGGLNDWSAGPSAPGGFPYVFQGLPFSSDNYRALLQWLTDAAAADVYPVTYPITPPP